jgi:hypothetical protein
MRRVYNVSNDGWQSVQFGERAAVGGLSTMTPDIDAARSMHLGPELEQP